LKRARQSAKPASSKVKTAPAPIAAPKPDAAPENRPGPKIAPWMLRTALVAITLAVYANVLWCGFALDGYVIRRDARVRALSSQNLALIWNKPYWWPNPTDRIYRPVTTSSLLLNFTVLRSGDSAFGYHAVNLVLHLVNVLLVFELLRKLLGKSWPAAFATALWGVHPVGPDAVANIVGRADLLAAMSVLGSLLLYIRIVERRGRRAGLLAIGLFAVATLGLLSKENAAVLIGLMVVCDLAFEFGRRAPLERRIPAYVAAGAALLVWEILRLRVFNDSPWPQMNFADNPLLGAGFWTARFNAVTIIAMELWLLVWPMRLSADRSYDQIPVVGFGDAGAWLALLTVAAILTLVVVRRRQDSVIFWATGFFALTLLPASNLIVIIAATMAERFLYLPAIGFAVAVAVLANRFVPRRVAFPLLASLIVLAGVRTYARNWSWKDELRLSADVESAPRSERLHHMRSEDLYDLDHKANLDAAIREMELAWEVVRSLPPARIPPSNPAILAFYYREKGDAAGEPAARGWYEKSVALALRARKASEAAEKEFDESQLLHNKPPASRIGYQPVYLTLGNDYVSLGRHHEAIEAYRYGIGIKPDNPEFYLRLADAYNAVGDPRSAAVAAIEKTLLFGFSPDVLVRLKTAYQTFADASCAIAQRGERQALDLTCPRVRGDMCLAYRDLYRHFETARDSERAKTQRDTAVNAYGCPASIFQ
jgi:tetratricopeptide (TPR) repeat protein